MSFKPVKTCMVLVTITGVIVRNLMKSMTYRKKVQKWPVTGGWGYVFFGRFRGISNIENPPLMFLK